MQSGCSYQDVERAIKRDPCIQSHIYGMTLGDYIDFQELTKEILGLMKVKLLPENFDKVIDFYIGLSDAHCAGAEWVEDFLEEYDLAHLFVSFLQSNKDFRQRFIERRGNDNGNL